MRSSFVSFSPSDDKSVFDCLSSHKIVTELTTVRLPTMNKSDPPAARTTIILTHLLTSEEIANGLEDVRVR
jgi:hypothetical protein